MSKQDKKNRQGRPVRTASGLASALAGALVAVGVNQVSSHVGLSVFSAIFVFGIGIGIFWFAENRMDRSILPEKKDDETEADYKSRLFRMTIDARRVIEKVKDAKAQAGDGKGYRAVDEVLAEFDKNTKREFNLGSKRSSQQQDA